MDETLRRVGVAATVGGVALAIAAVVQSRSAQEPERLSAETCHPPTGASASSIDRAGTRRAPRVDSGSQPRTGLAAVDPCLTCGSVAEGVGSEPTRPVRAYPPSRTGSETPPGSVPAVDLATVPDLDDEDDEPTVLDLDDDPPVPHPIAPQPFRGSKRAADLARIIQRGETLFEEGSDPLGHLGIESTDLPLCPG